MHINAFFRKTINKAMTGQAMHICTVMKDTVQSLQSEQNKYVFKRDLYDDSDGAHLTSFGMEFQTEVEAKENERTPSVALLCAG